MLEVIAELENWIRAGRFDKVEKQLRSLGTIDRKHAVAVANIARRVNCLNIAVKILNPIVRSTNKLQSPATALEKIEYADSLRQLGAVDEAWQLLNEVDATEHPQASIHKVFCLFSQWKYELALPILEEYVTHPNLTPYIRTVGEINLAAALIQLGRLEKATLLLSHLRNHTKSLEAHLLHGNSLELSAQVLILEGRYEEALKILDQASEVLKNSAKVASLYVSKWTAIAKSLLENRVTDELREVQQKAQIAKHWETVRDCDLFISHLDRDLQRMESLYYGTPYESFRQRILKFAGSEFGSLTHYRWCADPTSQAQRVLNLSSGRVEGTAYRLPLGQAIHRFLLLLSQDFYRPVPVMRAFGKIFPDEFMNATTSANRVHQIVKRTREWLKENHVPIALEEIDGAYRIKPQPGVAILVPAASMELDSREIQWSLLQNEVGGKPFTIHEANQILSFSSTNSKLLLRWAVGNERLQKLGKASATVYLVRQKVLVKAS